MSAAPTPCSIAHVSVGATERDRFILERRGPRPHHDPGAIKASSSRTSATADGRLLGSATVFLTGRECPWRCVMCDLWRYTIAEDTPAAPSPHRSQPRATNCASMPRPSARSSSTTPGASSILARSRRPTTTPWRAELDGLTRVVVESHPALVGCAGRSVSRSAASPMP